jgi:plasmid maintenance system antidote protein VapI
MKMMTADPSAADLRASIAYARLYLFQVAAALGVHPSTLSLQLNERRPLTPDQARRIAAVINRLADEAHR